MWRLCSQAGIVSVHARKRGRSKKPGPPVHDDLVERDFTAAGPNRLWLTDITEHPTGEGKLYLCAVKDVWSRRIVGYSIDSTDDQPPGRGRPEHGRRPPRPRPAVAGCTVHSDRGSQFRSRPFVARADTDTACTARWAGSPPPRDNAAMESFFALLQKNVLNTRRWATRDQLRLAIVTWIERTYHRRRRQRALGRLTPIEFETINRAAHAA